MKRGETLDAERARLAKRFPRLSAEQIDAMATS